MPAFQPGKRFARTAHQEYFCRYSLVDNFEPRLSLLNGRQTTISGIQYTEIVLSCSPKTVQQAMEMLDIQRRQSVITVCLLLIVSIVSFFRKPIAPADQSRKSLS